MALVHWKAALFIACAALGSLAHAEEWQTTDKALLGGALALLAIDWSQTRDLARRQAYTRQECEDPGFRATPYAPYVCEQKAVYHELNPLLPHHPTTGDVDRYFALATAATVGLAYVLPTTYRRYLLGGVVVVETVIVLHNRQVGLRVSF
jgi:hypothetical protein